MKGDILARIGFKSGVVEISEDVLCKHTIFIGSTGSGVGFFPNGQERVPLDVEESPTGYVVIKLANGF